MDTDGSDAGSLSTPVVRKPRFATGTPMGGADGRGAGNLDDTRVAEFLLKEKLYLAALEMHQELLERNRGSHTVQPLNEFFRDESRIDSFLAAESAIEPSISSTLAGEPDLLRVATMHARIVYNYA